tara:strand:+ start:4497 stop:5318 length:822 start_codon:yes stop_codon:yes gene_type:complete
MKITLERLREIITEEVIKEELAREIAAPAIAAMLQGSAAESTSEIFGDVFTHMYGEEALEAEADKIYADDEDAEPEEQSFPTEYQPGGAYGDRPEIRLGRRRPVKEIIQEEYYIYLIERKYDLLSEASDFAPSAEEQAASVASSKIRSPRQISPVDKYPGFLDVLEDPASTQTDIMAAEMAKERYELLQKLAVKSIKQIKDIDVYWQKYLNLGGTIRDAIAAAPEGTDIVGSLAKLHQRLRNRQEHEGAEDDPDSMRDFQGNPISRWSKSQDD